MGADSHPDPLVPEALHMGDEPLRGPDLLLPLLRVTEVYEPVEVALGKPLVKFLEGYLK
jgi:hypothetical protein